MLTEQRTDTGYADYVLLDQNGRPLAVIEAKRQGIQPYSAKQQALPYAQETGAPFIFLTNGDLIYFWDYRNDDAYPVDSFFSRLDLERRDHLHKKQRPLAEIAIPNVYLRQGEAREVRPYQQDAMKSMDHAFELGKKRFLIELPTGTGKTDLICLYIKRLIEAGRAERVLFLVDRDQLAQQAIGAINDLLGDQFPCYWRKAGTGKLEKQITVCLLQTMIGVCHEYTSGYFDVVIADECHRSIYGAWQTALTRFNALHIGLTATPARYIERNTLEFYDCKEDTPDFAYPIADALRDHYLIPYKFASGITHIIAEGADKDEETYDPVEFERKWTNEKSNRLMAETFDKMAWESYKDLAPRQKTGPGKAVVFAITKNHATRLTQYLNELHPELKGDYAALITSDVSNVDEQIRKFKREEYPQVAVSVGMLDTGFDCPEILHLVMCRRVRSPILYQQMRGRGTRRADRIGKQKFVIYDFFRNSEYFNDSETEIFVDGGSGSGGSSGPKPPPPGPRELVELGLEDEWLEGVNYVEVGPNGERVDKKDYVTQWEKAIQAAAGDDEALRKIRADEELQPEEQEALAARLNQPKNFFNEDNLRNAYGHQGGTIIDFIKNALGLIKVKSREERIRENFHAWLVAKNLTPDQAQYLSLLRNRGIAKGSVTLDDLFAPPLSILNAGGVGIELFGEQGLKRIIDDMNEHVFPKVA